MEELVREHMVKEAGGIGGDSTLHLKSFVKDLSALAGGDDSIFIVIDDRFDVWTEETKLPDGTIQRRVCENLLMIPPYFYWVD